MAAALAGCSDDHPATLRMQIEANPDVAPVAYVSLSIYAGQFRVSGRRVSGPLPTTLTEPVSDFTPWRLFAWGYGAGAAKPSSFATALAHPVPGAETPVWLTLSTMLPADTDGDAVPDLYDDCPAVPDLNQNGTCSSHDASPGDGGPADADLDAPPAVNLIANPDCESGTQGWEGWQATLIRLPLPRSGNYSCGVCVQPPAVEYSIDDSPDTVSMPVAGRVYAAQAWVRARPGATANQEVQVTLREWLQPGVAGMTSTGTPVAIDQTWRQVQVIHTVSQDAYALDVYISAAGAQAGDCFLLDDVMLARVL